MEANISKTCSESTDSNSTTSSERSSLPNYQRNEIGVGCCADDECCETVLCELTNNLKIEDHQNPKPTADCHDILHITKKYNIPILSGIEGIHKTSYYCSCNPCDTVQELMLSKFSSTEGLQKTNPLGVLRVSYTSPDVSSTCTLTSKCTEWLENAFTKKYGIIFTEGLAFSVDVVLLMGKLNGLPFHFILYPTINTAPKLAREKKVDDIFTLILKTSANKIEKLFNDAMNGKDVNYKNFQMLLLHWALNWEKRPYEAKNFLMSCVTLGQWAVCAEKKGVERASYFAPLIICCTIYRLELWSKISTTFWKDLAEAADELRETYS